LTVCFSVFSTVVCMGVRQATRDGRVQASAEGLSLDD
jgi:hypothetical protein